MQNFPPTVDELRELVQTRYVGDSRDRVENARAGFSVQPSGDNETVENSGHDDVVLMDDQTYRPVHGINETPKIIAKKKLADVRIKDEALKILYKLKNSSPAYLLEERYDYYSQRWFNTTRESELQLCEHVLLNPNSRPGYFAMQCRNLTIEDIPKLILTSLLAIPRDKGQCLSRFAVKTTTDMPFNTLLEILEQMTEDHLGFQLADGVVVAKLVEPGRNRNTTHHMKTNDYKSYAKLEPNLDNEGKLMSSRATITCSILGKRHVQTQVTYFNNGYSRNDTNIRNRFIEIEQTVKCMNRRVVIAEDRNVSHEYEIEDTMVSLKLGVPPVIDLIEYLNSDEPQ